MINTEADQQVRLVAEAISDDVKLLVLATNCTLDEFQERWQGIRDALAQRAVAALAADRKAQRASAPSVSTVKSITEILLNGYTSDKQKIKAIRQMIEAGDHDAE